MSNLLKAEFYKLFHFKSFWGICLFSLILGSVLILDNTLPSSTETFVNSSLYNIPLLYFLSIIFGGLYTGEDFDTRTIDACIYSEHKRPAVLFAKTVSCLTGSVAIHLLPLSLHCLTGLIIFGKPDDFSLIDFLQKTSVFFTAILAMGILTLLFAFIFKDIGKTLTVVLGIYFLMIFLLNSKMAVTAAVILPMGQIRLLSLGQPDTPLPCIIVIDILWIVFCYLGAHLAFCRTDLK